MQTPDPRGPCGPTTCLGSVPTLARYQARQCWLGPTGPGGPGGPSNYLNWNWILRRSADRAPPDALRNPHSARKQSGPKTPSHLDTLDRPSLHARSSGSEACAAQWLSQRPQRRPTKTNLRRATSRAILHKRGHAVPAARRPALRARVVGPDITALPMSFRCMLVRVQCGVPQWTSSTRSRLAFASPPAASLRGLDAATGKSAAMCRRQSGDVPSIVEG